MAVEAFEFNLIRCPFIHIVAWIKSSNCPVWLRLGPFATYHLKRFLLLGYQRDGGTVSTPGSPTSRLLMEYEMHLRNTLAKGMDAESYSLHTFEALLTQSMENLGNYKIKSHCINIF